MPDFSIEFLDLPYQHELLALQISRTQNSATDTVKHRDWPEFVGSFFNHKTAH